MRKTQWAISDRREFRQLLQDLGALIDDLDKLLPVSKVELDRLMEEDVSTLPNDIVHLRFIEEAQEAFAEDQAAEDIEDPFRAPDSFLMPDEVHLAAIEVGTAPPPASFMAAALSRPPVFQSTTFASVASSNASWATAFSHHSSLIEARIPLNPKRAAPSTCVKYAVGTCPSVQMMLQDCLPVEASFKQSLPSETFETADVAFECGGGCFFSLPFRFQMGAETK